MENPGRSWNNLIGFEVYVPFEEKYLLPLVLGQFVSVSWPPHLADSSKIYSEVI